MRWTTESGGVQRGMLMAVYAQQLRDPRWQKRRLEILSRDEWECTECGAKDTELHVHHARYKYGLKPWEYEDVDLSTMCSKCHNDHTQVTRDARDAFYSMLQQDLDAGSDAVHAMAGLLFIATDSELAAITEISFQTVRAAKARAERGKVAKVLVDALFAITEIAQEAERGKNKND